MQRARQSWLAVLALFLAAVFPADGMPAPRQEIGAVLASIEAACPCCDCGGSGGCCARPSLPGEPPLAAALPVPPPLAALPARLPGETLAEAFPAPRATPGFSGEPASARPPSYLRLHRLLI